MRDLESRIRAVVNRRTPKGWKVVEHLGGGHGRANPHTKKLTVPPLTDRYALLVFLHEVAHVELGHCDDPTIPVWRSEYEAEQFALKACRADGIAVPHEYIGIAKHDIRCYVEKAQANDPDLDIDEEVLRFVYPDNWKMAA